ncbi:MATE family efflux transporter [Coralloluteibacterium stylophorae]|uniref:Multidrug-efflux transporter n=1 Tax=Coralloluteibacterium stylophorae TaxID=1776034 RepID=A0A8J7VTP1_9GAMM|nr:MATE family efflux transporter [Coralloluteibacterium stylophorae]MBS7457020.1 MATE family efflux transporter [Coralloluteibacterium stylophorae]
MSSPIPRPVAQELRTTALLALPIVLGHVSSGLIGFVDTVLAGAHGTATQAGVTVGNAFWSIVLLVLVGTLLAVPPSVSQLAGAGREREIAPLFRQALWLALALGVALFVLLSGAAWLLAPIGVDPEIRPGAVAFLAGVRWGAPALALYLCMRYTSEGLGWTPPGMVFGFAGLVVLAPLGWALMFGVGGLPALGAAGLGFATATMLWLQAAGMALYLARAQRFSRLGLLARMEPPQATALAALLRLGLPIGVTVFMEGSLFVATTFLIAHLGAVQTAAHQIAINVATLCFMVPMGLAEATTVRVGRAVGARDGGGVRSAMRAGFVLVIATQLCSGTVLLLGHDLIAALYTRDAAVAALASTLMLYAAAFQFPDGVQVVSAGTLRGLKDTRVPMLMALAAYWVVGLPLGALLGRGLGWGAPGLWCGLIAGLGTAAVLMSARCRRMVARFAA